MSDESLDERIKRLLRKSPEQPDEKEEDIIIHQLDFLFRELFNSTSGLLLRDLRALSDKVVEMAESPAAGAFAKVALATHMLGLSWSILGN